MAPPDSAQHETPSGKHLLEQQTMTKGSLLLSPFHCAKLPCMAPSFASTQASPDEVESLARAYMSRQDLDEEQAFALANEVATDAQVMIAAQLWVKDGTWDTLPVRSGYSPEALSLHMRPSGVFNTLVRLRTHTQPTLEFLHRDRANLIARRDETKA